MSKKVLVTGADGFIGSHLVEELIRRGHQVKAFVLYNSFGTWGWLDHLAPEIKAEIEVFQGDIRDPNGVAEAVADCSVVYHLAALIAIPYSYHSPDMYVDTNIRGTLNVLQAARRYSIQKLIHTSTSEVYGTACFVPITEEHPLQGQSPYAATKIGADQLAESFYRSFDTPVAIVRPFNTYGPRQSLRAVIPTIITQLASGDQPIRLGSVHPTRDFNFVTDTVDGFLAAGAAQKAIGQVINIGSNFEVAIGTTVEIIAEIMGKNPRIIAEDQRVRPPKSEVERLWADNSKARELLGWVPSYAGLDGFRRGLEKTVEWFTTADNLRFYKPSIYNI